MAQTDFIALYRGRTIAEARLVAVTAEPEVVARVWRELAGVPEKVNQPEKRNGSPSRPLQVVRDAED